MKRSWPNPERDENPLPQFGGPGSCRRRQLVRRANGGLSRAFLDELDRTVRLVRTYPLIATQIEPEIRRFLFAHFPYSLIYGIDGETIVVIAVAHQHKEPRYWIDRLDQ